MPEKLVLFTKKDLREYVKTSKNNPELIESFFIALDSKAYFMLKSKDEKINELEEKINAMTHGPQLD